MVISAFFLLLGGLALTRLPITQFPDIVPPSVTVTAKYTGASAEVCAKAVALPLERAINGVPGMTYMQTVTSNDGLTVIEIFFEVGTDPDLASVGVQNRVTTILDELPEEVIKAGVTTEKEVNSMLLYLNLTSTDATVGEKFIYNFADINVLQELKRINGVGFAEIMGAREYSMRVWLKPDRLTAYNVGTDEVIDAIRAENVEAAPGKTGESSGRAHSVQPLQYVLRYTGKLFEPEQYRNIVLRANADGSQLRLKDVADVEFGSLTYGMSSKENGRPSASIMLKQRPGSNASEVIAGVKARMAELQKTSFPPGMNYSFAYDVSRFLDASIHEVLRTLLEAFVLVFIVVFVFLQDFRSTLIPALAVPVALVGALFFMYLFGFSINLLTLFALVLAIGIVVDDAIVVVEAVHSKLHAHPGNPRQATSEAMHEIGGSLVAITLVMAAVFVPVSFMSGPVGVFYRQFSLTLAIAIVISGLNALTLTPALCALLLKAPAHAADHHAAAETEEAHETDEAAAATGPPGPAPARSGFFGRLAAGFNRRFERMTHAYQRVLTRLAPRRLLTLGLVAAFVAGTWGVSRILPAGFIPTEDQGMIYVNVTTPAGATVERTEKVMQEVERIVREMKPVESVSTLAGYSLVSEVAGASYGMGMINLKPWDERRQSVPELIKELEEKTRNISDASIQFLPPPTVPGFGNASGFELRVLDKTGEGNLAKTAALTKDFLVTLRRSPAVGEVFTGFDPNYPQYLIHIDQDLAAKKGVTVDKAMSTLQTLMGSYYASNFIRFGQMYKVMVQAEPEYRRRPDDLLALHVKNNRGEMVPFSSFVRLERVYGPDQLTRYNMYTAALVNGEAAPGHSSGEALAAVRAAAKKVLPRGYDYEWSGMTREEVLSGNQAIYVFGVVLLFVYLLLAAQYESLVLPLPVLLGLPTGIFGAFLALKLTGLENNIYAQVALVMLVGLLGKNAILIIEFAEQRRREGDRPLDAVVAGAGARLRPILMTSFAFLAGLMPLVFADGAGALGNRSIGTAAAGGMFVGTFFGLLLIPGLYLLVVREKKPAVPVEKEPKKELEPA